MCELCQDPRNVELVWDQMFRATLNYGRKGLPMYAYHLRSLIPCFLLHPSILFSYFLFPPPSFYLRCSLFLLYVFVRVWCRPRLTFRHICPILSTQPSYQCSGSCPVGSSGKAEKWTGLRLARRKDKSECNCSTVWWRKPQSLLCPWASLSLVYVVVFLLFSRRAIQIRLFSLLIILCFIHCSMFFLPLCP